MERGRWSQCPYHAWIQTFNNWRSFDFIVWVNHSSSLLSMNGRRKSRVRSKEKWKKQVEREEIRRTVERERKKVKWLFMFVNWWSWVDEYTIFNLLNLPPPLSYSSFSFFYLSFQIKPVSLFFLQRERERDREYWEEGRKSFLIKYSSSLN